LKTLAFCLTFIKQDLRYVVQLHIYSAVIDTISIQKVDATLNIMFLQNV